MQSESERNSTSQSTEQRNQWSEEERITAGQHAAQSLNSPIENVIHDLRMMQIFRQWQTSEPKEENLRRSLYYEARAMQETALLKASMVGEAQRIVQQRQKENDPVEHERQRLDEQGYGLNFSQKEMS